MLLGGCRTLGGVGLLFYFLYFLKILFSVIEVSHFVLFIYLFVFYIYCVLYPIKHLLILYRYILIGICHQRGHILLVQLAARIFVLVSRHQLCNRPGLFFLGLFWLHRVTWVGIYIIYFYSMGKFYIYIICHCT